MKNLFFTILFLMFSSIPLSAKENAPSTPFFQASKQQPYHLSIGAVLFDQNGRIACHHFKEILDHRDVYILMRESMENNETPLMTLHGWLERRVWSYCTAYGFFGMLIWVSS